MTSPRRLDVGEINILVFQIHFASLDIYKFSFFPQTIRDWSDLPDALFTTAAMSSDYVDKFAATLVRARD